MLMVVRHHATRIYRGVTFLSLVGAFWAYRSSKRRQPASNARDIECKVEVAYPALRPTWISTTTKSVVARPHYLLQQLHQFIF
ncbi:hypothetical protein BDV24DRAFT_122402 [Aspergillus arachidicola]|uniref:Uncharacterized protein n=1 Tax=Aspergillus arachidicola TaxID=656916 RepID=A0A5N6YPU1_9EURO|nr:hypothetical protein BDV24DRAFT_122402 [Aspergillus arachidicola]